VRPALKWLGVALLSLLPLAGVIRFVVTHYIDVPFWDDWTLLGDLHELGAGTFRFAMLWDQHNEHRPLFARVILLVLAVATRWNLAWPLAANLVTAAGLFWVVARHSQRVTGAVWHLPLLSLAVFSLNQWESWMWGWELEVFLSALAGVGGLLLLVAEPLTPRRLVWAIVLGEIAMYDFADGLLFWPLGLVLLLVFHRGRTACVAFTVASALSIASYFVGYQQPGGFPSPSSLLDRGGSYLHFVPAYLGAPVGRKTSPLLPYLGVAGVLVLAGASFILVRWGEPKSRLAGAWAMGGLGVGSGLLTGLGRAGYWSGVAPRYLTFGSLLWIANLHLFAQIGTTRPRYRSLAMAAAVLVGVLSLDSGLDGARTGHADLTWRAVARADFVAGRDDHTSVLHPSAHVIRVGRETLFKYHLGVFR
jgi:hypothetical protein